MKLIHTAVTVLVLGATTTLTTANAATSPNFIGEPAATASADRTIVIGPGTNWVNVTQGETVKFVANGREFAINFDGAADPVAVDLRKLAPEGALDHKVEAEVDENPLYLN
jgi:hypothetical protein